MLKKITIAIWVVTALLLGVLLVNYYSNRSFIKNYDNGLYQQNELGFLGFTQPYIEHFNKGNLFFRLKNHTKAKQEYQTALNLKPGDPYDCKIRVNYALAYVEPIDVKKITKDNYEDTIKICETAKKILSEKGCATKNNDGHYYAAQKLYNEIDDFINQLKNQFENPTPTPTPDQPQPTRDPNDPTPTPTPTSKPDGDETPTPTPTPDTGDQNTPTPTPEGGQDQNTPTPTPDGGQNQGTSTPTPTPGGNQGTPTPTPDGNQNGTGTPTPTPGGQNGSGTPTPTGGDQGGSGTPTPTGGDQGQGSPTPTEGGGGQGPGTPTPTPGDDGGQDQGGGQGPKTPEEKIREIQERANKVRGGAGGGANGTGGKTDYNYGDSASW